MVTTIRPPPDTSYPCISIKAVNFQQKDSASTLSPSKYTLRETEQKKKIVSRAGDGHDPEMANLVGDPLQELYNSIS